MDLLGMNRIMLVPFIITNKEVLFVPKISYSIQLCSMDNFCDLHWRHFIALDKRIIAVSYDGAQNAVVLYNYLFVTVFADLLILLKQYRDQYFYVT